MKESKPTMSSSNPPLTSDSFIQFYKLIVTRSKQTPTHQWTNLLTQLSRHVYKLFVDAKSQKEINPNIALGQLTQLASNEFFEDTLTPETIAQITALLSSADDIRLFITHAENDSDTDLIDSMQRIQDEALSDVKNYVPLEIKTGIMFTSNSPSASKKDADDRSLVIKNRRELIGIYMNEAFRERDNKKELNALLKLDVSINEFRKLKLDLLPDNLAEIDRKNLSLCLREFAIINYYYVKNMGRRMPIVDAIEKLQDSVKSILNICEFSMITAQDVLFVARLHYGIASRYFRILDDVSARIHFDQALSKLEDVPLMTGDELELTEKERLENEVLEALLNTYISLVNNQKIENENERTGYYRQAMELIDYYGMECIERYENGVERLYDLISEYLFNRLKVAILDGNVKSMLDTVQTLISLDLPTHLSLEIFTRVLDDKGLKLVISSNKTINRELNIIADAIENNRDSLDDRELENFMQLKDKLASLDIHDFNDGTTITTATATKSGGSTGSPANTGLFATNGVMANGVIVNGVVANGVVANEIVADVTGVTVVTPSNSDEEKGVDGHTNTRTHTPNSK